MHKSKSRELELDAPHCCVRCFKTKFMQFVEHDRGCRRGALSAAAWIAICALDAAGWHNFALACADAGEQEVRTQFYLQRVCEALNTK